MLFKWNTKSKVFQDKGGTLKNSTTIELLKCIGIGLYKAYIKAITVADTRNSCLSAA